MTSAREAMTALPAGGALNELSNMLNNPKLALRMLDSNGDGRVTRDDIQTLLKRLGLESSAAGVLSKFLFQQLDTRNVGYIGETELANSSRLISGLMTMKNRETRGHAARR